MFSETNVKRQECGEIQGQCVKIAPTSSTETQTTAIATATQDAQTTPPSSSATAQPTEKPPQPGVLDRIKNFFKPSVIIIFAASGGGAILLLAIITCFCYRKRKQGRLLLAAYENPNRDAYQSVILSNGKPAFGDSSSASAAKDRASGGHDHLPSAANPAPPPERSPQPQYFDLYPPDSPAFQMTEQKPVGPLDRYDAGGNHGGEAAGPALPVYHPADRQQQQRQQEQYYHHEDERQQQQEYHQYHDGYGAPGVAVGGPGGDIHTSSPGDYAAGHIYTDYAAPQRPEDVYTGHHQQHHHHHHHQNNDQYHLQQAQTYPDPYLAPHQQQQQQQQYLPDGWVQQHYRQATPPQHAYAAAPAPAQSPPRPQRGPDVYLPAELAGHRQGMPHAV